MPREIRPIRIDGEVAFVTLNTGSEVMIDADKVHLVEGYNWSANSYGYAHRKVMVNGKSRNIYLHRVLAAAPDGVPVDHIDGNVENDRSANLRQCTHAQNMANQRMSKTNRSGLKGVTARQGKWVARIKVDGRGIHLGVRDTREEAHALYIAAAAKHFGEFARAA